MTRMTAAETDVMEPVDDAVVGDQIDGIAGGIMDLLENADPDHSGVAVSRQATEDEKVTKDEPVDDGQVVEDDTQATHAAATDGSKDVYTIKWQGKEKEVTHEELIKLAQQGFDYTQKTQKLSEERDQMAPYVGLAKRIQSDPLLASQIANYLQGQAAQQQKQAPPQKQFDDPIEQIKWEAKEAAKAEMRQELAQQLQPMQRQQAINAFKADIQRDPDYARVHQEIINHIAEQPPTIRKNLYIQVDQDPASYMELFQYFKNKPAKASDAPPVVTDDERPTVVRKTTRAPLLSDSGVSAPETASKEQVQRLKRQKAAALRSGDPLKIAEWLEDSGAIRHLY